MKYERTNKELAKLEDLILDADEKTVMSRLRVRNYSNSDEYTIDVPLRAFDIVRVNELFNDTNVELEIHNAWHSSGFGFEAIRVEVRHPDENQ